MRQTDAGRGWRCCFPRRGIRACLGGLGALTLLIAALADVHAGDAAAETGMGIVHGEIEMAASVCPGLAIDTSARDRLMAEKGVDPARPTDAFRQGVAEADARASEAIANERLRSFCLEMRQSYGVEGTSVPGLLREK